MDSAGVLGGAAKLHTLPLWARLAAVPSLLRNQRQITFDKHNGFVSLSPALTSNWPALTCAFKRTGKRYYIYIYYHHPNLSKELISVYII